MLYKTLPCQTAPCPSMLLQGLLIWRCQVWEYQRPHSSLNYLTFHDDIPAWSGRSYPLQGSVKRENGPNKKYSLWWLMHRTGGLAFLWFTVVQVTTQLVGLVYLSAQPQNYLPDVFPQSITHNSKPDIWVSSYITHVLLIYACVSIMRDICRDNHRCADRAYMLVELHYWVDLYLDITSSPPPVFWRQDWYLYISVFFLVNTKL